MRVVGADGQETVLAFRLRVLDRALAGGGGAVQRVSSCEAARSLRVGRTCDAGVGTRHNAVALNDSENKSGWRREGGGRGGDNEGRDEGRKEKESLNRE